MTWLLTASGKDINLQCVSDMSLSITDVAYSLANLNRFTGHALRPYSVAEHSLTVETIMREHLHVTNPAFLLAGLLHDAHESLTGDLSSPMKQLLGMAWQVEEDRIQRTVLRKFGVWTAFQACHASVKHADLLALSCERAQLMHPDGAEWPVLHSHPPLPWIDLGEAAEFTWHEWMQAFIDRYTELRSEISRLALKSTSPESNV